MSKKKPTDPSDRALGWMLVHGEIWTPKKKGLSPRKVEWASYQAVRYTTATGLEFTTTRRSFVAWIKRTRATRHNPYLPYKKGPDQ